MRLYIILLVIVITYKFSHESSLSTMTFEFVCRVHQSRPQHQRRIDLVGDYSRFKQIKELIKTNTTNSTIFAAIESSKKEYLEYLKAQSVSSRDAYVQYVYSDFMKNSSTLSQENYVYDFKLILQLTKSSSNVWKNMDKIQLKIELATLFELDENSLNQITIENKLDQIVIYVPIRYECRSLVDLDAKTSKILEAIKLSLSNRWLKDIQFEEIELFNFVPNKVETDANCIEMSNVNFNNFIDDKLIIYDRHGTFHITKKSTKANERYVFRLNGHLFKNEIKTNFHYKYGILVRRSGDELTVNVRISYTNDSAPYIFMQVINKIECNIKNSKLYLLHIGNSISYEITNSTSELILTDKRGLKLANTLKVSNTSYQMINEKQILLCFHENDTDLRLLEDLVSNIKLVKETSKFVKYMDALLSLIFSSISCLSIPILMIFYCKMKKGRLIIIMGEKPFVYGVVFALFIAHLSTILHVILIDILVVEDKMDPGKYGKFCALFAAFRQYVWSCTIFFMNVVALDLYFKGLKPYSRRASTPPTLIYFLYSFFVPLVLTIIPLSLHFGGNVPGIYNLETCFLGGHYTIKLCFLTPVFLLCFSNIRSLHLQLKFSWNSNAKRRINMVAQKRHSVLDSELLKLFFRTSALIGMSWFVYILIAFVDVFVKDVRFMYAALVASVQISLQGLIVSLAHFNIIFTKDLWKKIQENTVEGSFGFSGANQSFKVKKGGGKSKSHKDNPTITTISITKENSSYKKEKYYP